jgi:hypothetical protein
VANEESPESVSSRIAACRPYLRHHHLYRNAKHEYNAGIELTDELKQIVKKANWDACKKCLEGENG